MSTYLVGPGLGQAAPDDANGIELIIGPARRTPWLLVAFLDSANSMRFARSQDQGDSWTLDASEG